MRDLGWSSGKDPYARWRDELTGPWQFVGLGPPGSVQLRSGRVLVPAYHSYIRGLAGGGGQGAGVALPVSQLYNNLAIGHVLVSDDGGDTWSIRCAGGGGGGSGGCGGVGGVGRGTNENQLVELRNGSVLLNARSFATGSRQARVQARSDDGGRNFTPTRFVPELPEPFNGCQGSIAAGVNGTVYVSHPDPQPNRGLTPAVLRLLGANINLTGRDHLTVWRSHDEGATYPHKLLVDPGAAGYSSLQAGSAPGELWLLYEQSDREARSLAHLGAEALIGAIAVLNPDRFVLRRLNDDMWRTGEGERNGLWIRA